MRYYLDTEFNGFGGALISLAIAPADPSLPSFYRVVEHVGPIDPWVAQHVVPFLGEPPRQRGDVAAELALFLAGVPGPVTIVADWPTDFEHLLALLITGPGQMTRAPDFDMEFRRLPGFNTANHSHMPHNALADAVALRDHCMRSGL